jgi:hypothetical protein
MMALMCVARSRRLIEVNSLYLITLQLSQRFAVTVRFSRKSQFESYRMLGVYTMEKLCTDCHGDFRCFIRDILKRHLEIEAPDWLMPPLHGSETK